MVGIYKITNPNGRIYIGQSTDIKFRWGIYRKLKCKDQPSLYNSLKKYGVIFIMRILVKPNHVVDLYGLKKK